MLRRCVAAVGCRLRAAMPRSGGFVVSRCQSAVDGGRRAPLTRGRPARSPRVQASARPFTLSNARTDCAWTSPCSSNSQAPGCRRGSAPATDACQVGQAVAGVVARHQRGERLVAQRRKVRITRRQCRAGWRRPGRRHRPGRRATRIRRATPPPAPMPQPLARATASAAVLRSLACTSARGQACLIASAMAPLPVPRSSTRGRVAPARHSSAQSTRVSVSGRGTSTSGPTVNARPWNSRSTDQVGQRLAVGATREQVVRPTRQIMRQRGVVVRHHPLARPAEHMREQALRVEPIDAHSAGVCQRAAHGVRCRRDHHCKAWPLSNAASCCAARAACSAAITSSRSPSITMPSLYSVRLMR